jgi:hypothetical protein
VCSKKQLESAVHRKHLFDLYANLPPSIEHKRRVDELAIKAVRHLFMNRGRELEGVDESLVLEAVLKRVGRFPGFEAIRDYDKRKKAVVGCVVNAVAEVALEALGNKSNG